MGKGDFSWSGLDAAADNRNRGSGMMRRTEGTGANNTVGFAGDGVNLGNRNHFFWREGREEIRRGAGEKSLAGAGRARA